METRLFISIILIIWFAGANAFADQKGQFEIVSNSQEIFGDELSSLYNEIIAKDENIALEIQVPENYNSENPPGIMVYAGSPNFVRPPAGWLSVMKDKNLIWAASTRSDNASSIFQKTLLAMASVPLIQKDYNIDKTRIYITGEGRSASRTALDHPELFTGAILMGKRLWEDNAREKIKRSMDNGFVFVTRERNAFPQGTREAYYRFKSAGVDKLQLFFIQGARRYNRLRFSESIDFLDG
ncbi:hypothetical protein [Pseudemcibacter sp.]|uniref:hypothetical protein n=1 Tax=Pseudemcibacter sp. TaxID=2943293 RepID=UPI003F6A1652